MSETTEQPGSPAPEPVDAPAPADAPAPDTSDTPEPEHEEKPDTAARGGDRRFAAVTAKLAAAERVQAQQMAELEYYRRQFPQAPPGPEQQAVQERMALRAEVEAQIRAEQFHERGRAEHPDWVERCADLVKMGADPVFAQLLVEMPDGVKVAAALSSDPEAIERIAGLRSERARAVALGKYAATLDAGASETVPRTPPPRPMTRAPAPVRPVTGRAAPQFNEYSASGQQLVDHYMRQNMERQQGR